MSGPRPGEASAGPIWTFYFMIRVQRPIGGDSEPLSGMIEGLGTGEKRPFSSETELLHLLRSWPTDDQKMRAADRPGKALGE